MATYTFAQTCDLSDPAPTLDAGCVDWAHHMGHCDASDFGRHQFRIGRLYPDACDVGVYLNNPRTGNTVAFVLDEVVEGPGGEDVCGWNFTSHSFDADRNGIKLFVAND